jgi:hypothetical protein
VGTSALSLNLDTIFCDTITLEVINMDDAKMLSDIKSAGGWFVAEYAALIVERNNRLRNDKGYKAAFVQQIFRESGRDSELGGTRTRVNALLRIMERHELIKALEYVIGSDNINRNEPDAVKNARQTLNKLK